MNNNNNIKTSVTLNVKDAEKKLKLIENRIKKIQQLTGNSGTTFAQFSKYINKSAKEMQKLDTANQKASKSATKLANSYKKANSNVSVLTKNVRTLVSTYLGVMGARMVVNASDTITSAENKLNNLNGGNRGLTQEQMNKMFNSAQNSRMGYSDMMGNVAKSMTLAPDAFQGNIDNAIRFQEIMAKAYTLGGASAAEQSSSMYQLIQGLGSGVLQGDELRSVREGAPLAYQAIEKFAQGVYGAEENLKDLASQGKITSELVVKAMMDAGSGMDEAFETAAIKFDQTFTMLKNIAMKSFEPVLQKLNDGLNTLVNSGVLNAITYGFQFIAGVINLVFDAIAYVYNFIVANWSTIRAIIITVGVLITGYLIYKVILLGNVIAARLVAAISRAMMAITLFGIKGAIAFWGINIPLLLTIAIIGILIFIAIKMGVTFSKVAAVINGAMFGIGAVISAVAQNIGIAFSNLWGWVSSSFWDCIAELVEGLDWLAKPLEAIAELFGKSFNYESFTSNLRAKADSYKPKDFVSVGDAWSNAYNKGYAQGDIWGQKVEDWTGDKLNSIKGKLGLTGLPTDTIDPNAYNANLGAIGGGVGDIADNTGSMAKSMELSNEDLEYLRKIADMEWKKEFTTANINVKMDNNINSEADYEGFVTRLRNDMYEEMVMIADGAYVY